MRAYIYRNTQERGQEVEGDGSTLLTELLNLDEGEQLWTDDEADTPLVPTATLASIGDGRRVFCGTCTRVIVFVRYNGETASREFPPAAPIRRIMRWALKEQEFAICDPSPGDFDLRMCSADVIPDPEDLVGAFVGDDCEVCFDLCPAEKFQGSL